MFYMFFLLGHGDTKSRLRPTLVEELEDRQVREERKGSKEGRRGGGEERNDYTLHNSLSFIISVPTPKHIYAYISLHL
jgi:hypothetical protein